jgi:hypothetical protein
MNYMDKFAIVFPLGTSTQIRTLGTIGELQDPLEKFFLYGAMYNQICSDLQLTDKDILDMQEKLNVPKKRVGTRVVLQMNVPNVPSAFETEGQLFESEQKALDFVCTFNEMVGKISGGKWYGMNAYIQEELI